jgi:hypothetical protein
MHHSSLNDLLRHLVKPGLDTLLQLAAASTLPVKECVGRTAAVQSSIICAEEISMPRRTCLKYDWQNVSSLIQQEISRDGFCASLRAICSRQGWDSGYVAARRPSLARDLIQRFRVEISKQHQKRENDERGNLQAIISASALFGRFPSHRRLKKVLASPGSLRNPELRAFRKQLLARDFSARIGTDQAVGIKSLSN